jgi:hypothetical protein
MDKIIKPNLTGTYLKRYVFTVMIKYRVFGFNTSRCGKLIADWLVEMLNPGVTLYEVLLDVSV